MSEKKVSKPLKRVGEALKRRVRDKVSEGSWLSEGYEVRKGQMEFIEEARCLASALKLRGKCAQHALNASI